MTNLRPAPFALTPATVSCALGEAGKSARMVDVPLSPVKLVDQPAPSGRPARLRLGYRNERPLAPLPPTPSQLRALRLERAIAFLTRNGVAVTICDRDSHIRRFRLSAKRDNYLADDVVAYAIQRGFEPDHG